MTDRSALIPLVDRLAKARVCVVGDVMLDRFVSGAVERISPEAPIPVLRVVSDTAMLGGAGNVVRTVSGLGGRSTLIAAIGGDAAGQDIRGLTEAVSGLTPKLVSDAARRTGIKTRFVAGSQQLMRADDETVGPLSDAAARRIERAVAGAVKRSGAVALSDYGKGVLSDAAIRTAIAAAAAAGVPVIVDPKGADYARYLGADLVTPNRAELAAASGLPTATDSEVVAAARRLMKDCGIKAVLATRSQDGMTLVTTLRGKAGVHHLPAEKCEVFDVSGAGDTVVAAMASALAAGADFVSAARLANVAAGIAVSKVGTAAVYADEVVDALRHQDLSDAEAKVLSLERLLDHVEVWRRQGKRIGFTNGCFDLLHPGHVSLLAQARNACDRLIVGLNADVSVRRLKGKDRPVQNEAARAAVLASLGTVDAVVLFSDLTPIDLIEAIGPDVLVKGADYAKKNVVGGAFVERNGGRVLLARLEDGHSTTGTIARLAKGKAKARPAKRRS